MKILYVDNNPDFILSHRLPVLLAAQTRGWEVHVAAPEKPSARDIEAKGFVFHPIRLNRSGMNPISEIMTIRCLSRLYRKLRPDLVHHISVKPVVYGGIAARLAKVPAVVNAFTGLGYAFIANGPKGFALRRMIFFLSRLSFAHGHSVVLFQNEDDRRVFVDGGGLDVSRSTLIPGSGVDTSTFTPSPEPEGTPVVVFPARLLRDKGVREFIDAAWILRREGVDAKFVLAGAIDAENPAGVTPREVASWVSHGDVVWDGFCNDMPALFAASHVVCLPSYREGFPKALIEAASCARAVVTTDVAGCRDAVVNGETGLLVPPRDAVALATALGKLIADEDLRRRMGAAGRRRVEAMLSVERIVASTLGVYDSLLGR